MSPDLNFANFSMNFFSNVLVLNEGPEEVSRLWNKGYYEKARHVSSIKGQHVSGHTNTEDVHDVRARLF